MEVICTGVARHNSHIVRSIIEIDVPALSKQSIGFQAASGRLRHRLSCFGAGRLAVEGVGRVMASSTLSPPELPVEPMTKVPAVIRSSVASVIASRVPVLVSGPMSMPRVAVKGVTTTRPDAPAEAVPDGVGPKDIRSPVRLICPPALVTFPRMFRSLLGAFRRFAP